MAESPELTQNFTGNADRRIHTRHRVRALAYVELDENNGGIVLNIGEGGFAVRAAEAIHEERLPRVRILMQQSKQPLEMSGEIAWTSDSRKEAGVRFIDLREDAVSEIRTWISQEVSPGNMSKQPPVARQAFRETLRRNESLRDASLGNEVIEAETRGNGEEHAVKSSVIRESEREFSEPSALTEKQRYASMLFPKSSGTTPVAQSQVLSFIPAIRKSDPAPRAWRGEKAPEDWMDFRIHIGRGWVAAALVTFLVAISFAGGMAVRRGGLIGLWRHADTAPSNSARTQSSVQISSPADTPPKPLQIEIVDLSNRRWVIPASVGAIHSAGNGVGVATSGISHDTSENLATPSSDFSQTAEYVAAGKPSAVPGGKGTGPLLLSLPERSVSATGSVAISSQRSFAVPAESSQRTPQPGKNLKVGQLVNLVDPLYPPDAEQKHIEGTVKLHATIGVDGSIKDVQPLSGPPSLVAAALTAVREWRYNPTLLNGQPIETQEDINLVFRLPN